MNPFDSILLPLDGSPESAKAVGCAVWLANTLGATLHVLHSTKRPVAPAEALERLRAAKAVEGAARPAERLGTTLQVLQSTRRPATPAEALERLRAVAALRARTVLHETSDEPVSGVLDEAARQHVKLVVLSARGESASAGLDPRRVLGRVASALVEQTDVPVVMAPPHYREVLPWRSMLVASSGEPAADEAVATAVRLSVLLKLPVTVVHVTFVGEHAAMALGRYADAPQHEVPARLEQMVKCALVGLSPEECSCVDAVALRFGDPVTEALAEVQRRGSSVLALGWHGAPSPAHALVAQGIIERAECPLLLVRQADRSQLRLTVGDAIGD